jgi:peroxiredoxin
MKKIRISLFIVPAVLLFIIIFTFQLQAVKLPETSKVENFSLKDYNGKVHSLKDYKKSKAIVLIFVSTQCPVSNAYNERMAELQKKYSNKSVTFLGINSNKEEKVSDIKSHAEKNKFGFPVLKDENNKIADKIEASVTPEVYILNPDLEILYHGRIDDSKDAGNVSSNDAAAALDEILAGKKVSIARTKAFGCSIKRIES